MIAELVSEIVRSFPMALEIILEFVNAMMVLHMM